MELKKEDFVLMRNYQDREFLALRKDFFDKEESVEEKIEEVFESKGTVEIEMPIPEPQTAPSDLESNPPPEPKPDALAKARAAKASKRDALKAELEALKE